MTVGNQLYRALGVVLAVAAYVASVMVLVAQFAGGEPPSAPVVVWNPERGGMPVDSSGDLGMEMTELRPAP